MKLCKFLTVVSIAALLATTSAQGFTDDLFEGTQDDNWANPNNWSEGLIPDDVPDLNGGAGGSAIVGDFFSGDQTAHVYTGTNSSFSTGGLEIGMFANATLTVDAGASITANGGWAMFGGDGGATYTTTVNLNGTITAGGGSSTDIGGFAKANFTLGAGARLNAVGSLSIGMTHYMAFSGNSGYETQFVMGPGSVINASGSTATPAVGNSIYFNGFTANTKFQINGGTIDTPSANYRYSGYSFWQMGGTFEITADSRIANAQVDSNVAVFAEAFFHGVGAPIIKFTGSAPVLTVDGDVWFRALSQERATDPIPGQGDPNLLGRAAQLDVSGLVVTPGVWTTVIDVGGTTSFGNELTFVAGTDANWSLQILSNDVQVKYGAVGNPPYHMGDINLSGFVDDDDLSLLLSHWNHAADPWGFGNLSDDDPYGGTLGLVNDDDLSLLLAHWNHTTGVSVPAPMGGGAVPEPATMLMLAIGAAGALIRKRKR